MTTLLKARDTHAQNGVRSFESAYAMFGTPHESGALQVLGTDLHVASALEAAVQHGKIPASEIDPCPSGSGSCNILAGQGLAGRRECQHGQGENQGC